MRRWFFNLSIKTKTILLMSLVSGAVLVLAAVAILANDVLRFRQNMIEELYSLTDLVGLSNSAGVYFGIPDTAFDNLTVLEANPRIVEAVLFTQNGEYFASYRKKTKEEKQKKQQENINTTTPPPIVENMISGRNLKQYYFATDNSAADSKVEAGHFFRNGHLELFRPIVFEGNTIGTVYLRSDLKAFKNHLRRAGILLLAVLGAAFLLTLFLAALLQRLITDPVYRLLHTMDEVTRTNDYSRRETGFYNDELGALCESFNRMLTRIEKRDKQLAQANTEIGKLNERLKAENMRMGAELEVTRQLQQMVLPRRKELDAFKNLDIACFMEPADEVGGDYYDWLTQKGDGTIKIGIGDVTGHGLASGVVMLMVQTAVRTLVENGVTDSKTFLNVLNRTIHENVKRMGEDKSLTLSMLDYAEGGCMKIFGQHEEVLVARSSGKVERHSTVELGFMVGMVPDVDRFYGEQEIHLERGDTVVLYTDGITETMSEKRELYGVKRISKVMQAHYNKSAQEIQDAIIEDVNNFRGKAPFFDDITLLVFKRLD